jgi:hypothetical protein
MTEEKNVNRLEDQLAGTLRPIAPRKEFVHGLGHRIKRLRRTMQDAGAGTWRFILLALAGLLSLGLLLALAGRTLYDLFDVRKQGSERA